MVNLIAPHLGISFSLFWISTFFGVLGVSFIVSYRYTNVLTLLIILTASCKHKQHVQLGMTLDEMTSSDDFHLITVRVDVASVGAKLINHGSFQWKNFFGLAGIVVAVLIPVVSCLVRFPVQVDAHRHSYKAIRYIYASDIKDAAEAEEEVGEIALPWADGESNIPQSAQRPNPKRWKSSSKLVFLDRGSQDLSSQEGSRRTRSRSGSSPPDDPHADSESIQLKESTSKVTTET